MVSAHSGFGDVQRDDEERTTGHDRPGQRQQAKNEARMRVHTPSQRIEAAYSTGVRGGTKRAQRLCVLEESRRKSRQKRRERQERLGRRT
ncbi:unnamed protein product [Heligmosomoides polygyrus]|uniref:Uncharacterized protein n=1 Tax=Heligmosomoides polygyrus TaxID=6339 RepID=A0A183FW13_HELPZ|nr:unnamed protein product [Heligmosomoides polygyrus]